MAIIYPKNILEEPALRGVNANGNYPEADYCVPKGYFAKVTFYYPPSSTAVGRQKPQEQVQGLVLFSN